MRLIISVLPLAIVAVAQRNNLGLGRVGLERQGERRDALPVAPFMGIVTAVIKDFVALVAELTNWLKVNETLASDMWF